MPAAWPVPARVRAGITTRGSAQAPFNLALHVGDDPEAVRQNRDRLRKELGLPGEPAWLDQQHGSTAIHINNESCRSADAGYTDRPGTVCAVLTADCIPLLLAGTDGTEIAAVHVGWRGLCAGVAAAALARFRQPPQGVTAWLGPHIRAAAYIVGAEVRDACLAAVPGTGHAFSPAGSGRWHADLEKILQAQLRGLGLAELHAAPHCTHRDTGLFWSHRRGPPAGRMASLIWLES